MIYEEYQDQLIEKLLKWIITFDNYQDHLLTTTDAFSRGHFRENQRGRKRQYGTNTIQNSYKVSSPQRPITRLKFPTRNFQYRDKQFHQCRTGW